MLAEHHGIAQQYSSFMINDQAFAFNVMEVQEIVKPLSITRIPHCENYIKGLINLRGQIAIAIGLNELLFQKSTPEKYMNIICKFNEKLYSFLVDEIGDVLSVNSSELQKIPMTVQNEIKKFSDQVYDFENKIFCILKSHVLVESINNSTGG